ncbi:DS-domain-containing protein [Ophiobolus disseminans]|uniref:Deoxyhypusine synthase n=1 Tax=Ophiobolus disseminans TaxID=1469910 RepID=A0A6A6ZTP2_9PLEO|nr:DS-domain-containing protein [Ophiobolus disseminans]
MSAAATNNTSAPAGATDAVLKPSAPIPEGSREVQGIDFNQYASRSITVEELVGGYANMGFQATSVGEAVRIINDMRAWRDPAEGQGTTIFLGYTSNLISSGLRETLRYLVQHKHVAAVVTTAGGVEEDFIKCLAPTYLGSFSTPGAGLRQQGMNRIGNLVVPNSNYCAFEDWVVPILDTMLEEQEASKKTDEPLHWTPSKVIHRLGKEINDERSVYYWAWKNDIPVFCPALTDGSLGDMLYFHTFKSSPEQLRVDIVEDIRKINTIAVRAKRTGMIVLGGGIVKHHIANANLMRNGAESAVYINTAQEFDGSDAGARPDEAVSWGKIKVDGDSVKVYAEATIVFPLIVAATFARPCPVPDSADSTLCTWTSISQYLRCFTLSTNQSTQIATSQSRPPLHFGQQPSSPQQPADHALHAPTPASPSPPPPADVDMSSSATTLAPAGQRHDREAEGLANGPVEEPTLLPGEREPDTNTVVEVAALEDDTMDTTPDVDAGLVLADASVGPLEAAAAPAVASADGAAGELGSDQLPLVAPSGDAADSQNPPPIDPPPPADPNAEPPPPPPPVEPVRSDSETSDDDDSGLQPWHPMQEDTSAPDEAELKEMEASTEHSALDHEYWENKTFLPLEEPEYTAGDVGRISWSIDAYNGTREKPNRDIVMKSDVVTVGGHQWQIKFYPKGNDSDYLSVYLECLSVVDPKKKDDDDKSEASSRTEDPPEDPMETTEIAPGKETAPPPPPPQETPPTSTTVGTTPTEPQHAPLPLLDGKSIPKRKSVAAQVSVVLYNPTEPRVHYHKTALHRFCSGSPDWGWTRFHGPYYDIAHRMRGNRAPLLQSDKLAFTGYIRIVEDDTNCLWEHHSRENPWDSFAMTGLQSLVLGEDASAPGGNMISAVASWLLFKPFRTVLYAINTPDPNDEPFTRPKPLVTALQKVLYMLRTQVEPGAGAVPLDDVLDALDWYGIHDHLEKVDVIETWEILRAKLEEELHGTAQADALMSLFGPKRDYSTGIPTYQVPVRGVESMQKAVDSATNFTVPGQPLPQMLTVELDRQDFDVKTRSYVKLLDKVTLDDRLTIGDTSYTLYGFVVHKQTLQSYVYQPLFRPEGPGSRWYSYSDSKDENRVKCLTKREAVDEHEGQLGTGQVIGNDPVAYVAMYIRDDIAASVFNADAETEQWTVPDWVRAEVEKDKASAIPPPMSLPPVDPSAVGGETEVKEQKEPAKSYEFHVVDSRTFKDHEGPGFFDAYSTKFTNNIQIGTDFTCEKITATLAPLFPDIQDRRQILFWFLDPVRGSLGRPQLMSTGKTLYSRGAFDRYTESKDWTLAEAPVECRFIWVHIIDFAELPELPKPEETKPELAETAPVVPTLTDEMQAEISHVDDERAATPPQEEVAPHTEDTPMSDPDEPIDAPTEPQALEIDNVASVTNIEGLDTAMVEVESAEVPDPPSVDVLIPESTALGDTEMGGTQEDLLLPPPPPISIPPELSQPPPPARPQTPDPPPEEIYFFLKLWNAEKQILESRGSHVCLRSARVDETVVKLLGFPMEDKKKVELFEEDELTTTRTIKHRRSFAQLDLQNTAIIIASPPITAEQRSALADHAVFADPQGYLAHRALARNFPHKMNGHVTYNYFSDQYYKGEIKNGYRHGHGERIYHSGATYSGSFRLNQCHGHGLYTFQNGDTYDGDWVNNQQHGSGTFVEAASGNTYVGGWKNDKKFGEGVTHWKNAQEAERLCRICWDEPAEAAFYDCGHVVACLPCAREVQSCPVCRKRVLSAMKLYYVA